MPRFRRQLEAGCPVHIIARFFRRDFVLDSPAARAQYLKRLELHLVETGWLVFSFALMSSHVHIGAIAGVASFEELFQPLHSGFATWLRLSRGLVGHVFAGRPATHSVAPERCARLIAYHHNNPVKAGIVDRARGSTWTSHRAYINPAHRPDWLHVALGLELAGFDDTPRGRAAFEDFVDANPYDEIDLSDPGRSAIRKRLGSAVELAHPQISKQGRTESLLLVRPDAKLHTWQGTLTVLIECVAAHLGLCPWEITCKSRRRTLASARRICVLVALMLGRSRTATASALGLTQQAATKLERSATDRHRDLATKLAFELASTPGDLVG